jgi:hypothetical protein
MYREDLSIRGSAIFAVLQLMHLKCTGATDAIKHLDLINVGEMYGLGNLPWDETNMGFVNALVKTNCIVRVESDHHFTAGDIKYRHAGKDYDVSVADLVDRQMLADEGYANGHVRAESDDKPESESEKLPVNKGMWSKEDDIKLWDLRDRPVEELTEIFNRTESSIQSRLYKITKEKRELSLTGKDVKTPTSKANVEIKFLEREKPVKNKRRRFTNEEIDFITNSTADDIDWVARQLGRTASSIQGARYQIKAGKLTKSDDRKSMAMKSMKKRPLWKRILRIK